MMEAFREISPREWAANPFGAIGEEWMLVTASKDGGRTANPMTASWGGVGILWNKPVAFVFLRPQRFTRELVDKEETFSLAFLDEGYREQYKLCGAKSGRDMDKAEACGFTVAREGDTPYLQQAHTVLLCRKLYRQALEPGCFVDAAIDAAMYPARDHHIVYVAEIQKVLVK